MPSPLGHALAGVAVGWAVDPAERGDVRRAVRHALVFAAIGMAPDADLLVGAHSGPTHGLGAAVLAGFAAWAWLRARGAPRRATTAAAVALAYASHTLLDWLGMDSSPPIGIMALWPASRDYYESQLHVFNAISRRYWLPEFWTYNIRAVVRELAVLLPIATAALALRRRR